MKTRPVENCQTANPKQCDVEHNVHSKPVGSGGLVVRTDLRAGLTWDDPESESQQVETLLKLLNAGQS